jgi:hypothetical protein
MPVVAIHQLVLDQLEKDPNCRKGPWLIREAIQFDTGINLTRCATLSLCLSTNMMLSFRDSVTNEMRIHDPEGFELRQPSCAKIHQTVLVSIGPHEIWSKDGHDKLSTIGFPVYGIRDVWSGK